MLTLSEFKDWLGDYRTRFPAVREYVAKQPQSSRLIDTWHQVLVAFEAQTLAAVTAAILAGELDPVPNTQLGQFGHEIRQRCRQYLDLHRGSQPQDWHETAKPLPVSQMLQEPKMRHMLACARAADRLTGSDDGASDASRYAKHGSVYPDAGSYEAAVVMADDHSEAEERACLATFAREGVTWQQIQDEARRSA